MPVMPDNRAARVDFPDPVTPYIECDVPHHNVG